MRKIVCSAFSTFLLLVNAFILGFITYYLFTQTFEIEPAMIYLYFHSVLAVWIAVGLLVGIWWNSEKVYRLVLRFFKFTYYPFLLSHITGIIYYSFIIGDLKNENERLPYRIYIFYYMIDVAVFWYLFNPAMDVGKQELEAKKTRNKVK